MKNYTLNTQGQAAITKEVLDVCSQHDGIKPEAFFEDAERSISEGGSYMEIGAHYTDSGNPFLVGLSESWFDAKEVDA